MKCREVMERAVDPSAAVTCEEVRAHTKRCDACRRQLEAFHALQRAMALKRYERRLEQRAQHCAQAVHNRVCMLRAPSVWSAPASIPPLRLFAVLASAVVLLTGVYVAVHVLHHAPANPPPVAMEEEGTLHAGGELPAELPSVEDLLRMDRRLWDYVDTPPRPPWMEGPAVDSVPYRPAGGSGHRVLTGFENP